MMKKLAIFLIVTYQKHLSPYKGFSCAHRRYHGGRSCSMFAVVAVRRSGVSALWRLLPKRFHACGNAHQALLAKKWLVSDNENKKKKKDRNITDACDSCDGDWGCNLPSGCHCDGCNLSASQSYKTVKVIFRIVRLKLTHMVSG
ncbi:MAG: Putative membrane protein insertion efficiency factor [Candidatus Erwinia impunctatus]|nr:Putative membrane protein insertion efficiency factor [Culicoides impunctatus]